MLEVVVMQLVTKDEFLEKARDFTNFKLRTFRKEDRPKSLGFMFPMMTSRKMLVIENKYIPAIDVYIIALREDILKDKELTFEVILHEVLEMTLTGTLMEFLIEEEHLIELYKVFDKSLCIEDPYLNRDKGVKISHFLTCLSLEETCSSDYTLV